MGFEVRGKQDKNHESVLTIAAGFVGDVQDHPLVRSSHTVATVCSFWDPYRATQPVSNSASQPVSEPDSQSSKAAASHQNHVLGSV